MSQYDYDNVVIAEIEVLYREQEQEWASEDPIIGLGYGAYSKDTRLIRVGDGVHTWSELKDIDPVKYVGPHAYSHMPGGNDEIIFTSDQMPHTPAGTVLFGAGVGAKDRPVPKYTLYPAYICEDYDEVNTVKSVASNQENIFNTWERYSHATLGDHYDGDKLIYTCTDEDKGYEEETSSWYYDNNYKRIRNTTNSYTPIGLVSPTKYTEYTFESTLIISDDDFDDDSMGLVLAYAKDSNGKNHTLSILRSIGGNSAYTLYYNHGKSNASLLLNNSKTVKWGTGYYGANATEAKYWSSTGLNGNRTLRTYLFRTGVKIKIVRTGNVFTITTSNFTNHDGTVVASKYMYPNTEDVLENEVFNCDVSTDPLEETKIVLDLDNFTISHYDVTYDSESTAIESKTWVTSDLPIAQKDKLVNLKIPGSIGYCCCSNKNTTWNDIVFVSPDTKIYNALANTVEVPSESGYVVDNSSSLYKDFSPQGVFLYNDITKKLFYLYDDKIISVLSGTSSGSSSGSGSSAVVLSGFNMFAEELGNLECGIDTDTVIQYNIKESSHTYFTYENGVFTYVNAAPRKMCIIVQQRYVRMDTTVEGLASAYSINTSINTSRSNPTNKTTRYTSMSLGLPWTDSTLSMIHTFTEGETFSVSFNSGVETRTYFTDDDPDTPINCVSNLIIYSVD